MISMEEAMRDVIRRLRIAAHSHEESAKIHERDARTSRVRAEMEWAHSGNLGSIAHKIEGDLEKELAMEKERREAEAVAAKEFAAKAAAEEAERQRLEEAP